MIYYHKLNLGFNNSNLVSFSSFTFASCDMENIYICLSFLYHYFHNHLPETDTKPRASPIVSYVKLLGMNVIQEPPIYFNAFNIFSLTTIYIIQNSLFLQISQLFVFFLLFLYLLMPILHFPQSLSLTFLCIRWLPSITSFCFCEVLINRLPSEQISFCSHQGNHLALPNSQIHIDIPAFIFSSCSFLYHQLPYLNPLK